MQLGLHWGELGGDLGRWLGPQSSTLTKASLFLFALCEVQQECPLQRLASEHWFPSSQLWANEPLFVINYSVCCFVIAAQTELRLVSMDSPFLCLLCKCNHATCGVLWLASWGSSLSFLLPDNISLHGCSTICLSTHQLTSLDCFSIWAMMAKSVVSI